MNEIYRYRSLEKAYDEVRHAYFYAHSSRYQNDANEYTLEIQFDAPPETWESFFKHHFQSVYKAVYGNFKKRQVVICNGNTWKDDFSSVENYRVFEKYWVKYREDLQIQELSLILSKAKQSIDNNLLSYITAHLQNHAEKYVPVQRPEFVTMHLGPKKLFQVFRDVISDYQGKGFSFIRDAFKTYGIQASIFDDPNLDPDLRWLALDFNEEWFRQFVTLSIPDVFTSSFCEKNDNPVLWGHYADYNQGVCLIYSGEFCDDSFIIPQNGGNGIKLKKIDYRDDYLPYGFFAHLAYNRDRWNLPPLENLDGGEHILEKAIFIKHPFWHEEREWRYIVKANEVANDHRIYYHESALKGVIFGCRTPIRHIGYFVSLLKSICEKTERKIKHQLFIAQHEKSGQLVPVELNWPP